MLATALRADKLEGMDILVPPSGTGSRDAVYGGIDSGTDVTVEIRNFKVQLPTHRALVCVQYMYCTHPSGGGGG